MRKILLPCLILCSMHLGAQTLHVANNNPGAATGVNVHTGVNALQDAVNAASEGDVIYVVPSPSSYGDIIIDKGVTLFGIGIRPEKDLGLDSYVDRLDINASNIRISGIESIDTWYLGWTLNGVELTNLTFENCRFGRLRMRSNNGVSLSNMLVRNNVVVADGGTFDAKNFELYVTSNVTITNNYIITTCCSNSGTLATGVIFTNNIFAYSGTTGNSGNTFTGVNGCTFEYNIFFGSWQTVPTNSFNNTFNYNLSFGNADNTFTQIGDTNGNTGTGNVADGDPMFTNLTLSTAATWSNGYDLTPLPGSAALNIDGSGGTAGVTGGLTPWDPEATLLPTIQAIALPSTIPAGTDLPITIKAKGN